MAAAGRNGPLERRGGYRRFGPLQRAGRPDRPRPEPAAEGALGLCLCLDAARLRNVPHGWQSESRAVVGRGARPAVGRSSKDSRRRVRRRVDRGFDQQLQDAADERVRQIRPARHVLRLLVHLRQGVGRRHPPTGTHGKDHQAGCGGLGQQIPRSRKLRHRLQTRRQGPR